MFFNFKSRAPRLLFICSALYVIGGSAPGGASGAPVLVADRQAAQYQLTPASACPSGVNGNCSQSDTTIEPSIAANPANPLNAVTSFQEGRFDSGGAADLGYATTFDGGQTWLQGDVPGLTTAVGGRFERASDAAVAFGPDNNVYINSLLIHVGSYGQLIADLGVSRSQDGGRTWGAPSLLNIGGYPNLVGGLFVDKNWIVVDNGSGPGHHRGRVYVVWDNVQLQALSAYSDDMGATWATGGFGFPVSAQPSIGALPLVMPNGDLAVVYDSELQGGAPLHGNPADVANDVLSGGMAISMGVSHGAGRLPTGSPLVFDLTTVGYAQYALVRGQRAGEFLPSAAVNPNDGHLVVAWNDSRFNSQGVNDVVVSDSVDGLVWSTPVRINPAGVTDSAGYFPDHWCPAVGVGGDGSVRIAYRQRSETYGDPSIFGSTVDTFFQQSLPGGGFTDPLKLNTVTSDMGFGAVSRNGVFLGDYDQMATAGNRSYVTRSEAVRVSSSEPASFPPTYHHQRAWVATVTS